METLHEEDQQELEELNYRERTRDEETLKKYKSMSPDENFELSNQVPRTRCLTAPSGPTRYSITPRLSFTPSFQSMDRRMARKAPSFLSVSSGPPTQFDETKRSEGGSVVYIKIAELCVATLCTIHHALAVPQVACRMDQDRQESIAHHVSDAMFPFVAFSSDVIITTVTLLGYMLNQPLPPMLGRAFDFVLGAMFLTAGGVNIFRWMDHTGTSLSPICAGFTVTALGISGFLALAGATLHILDAILNLRASLNVKWSTFPGKENMLTSSVDPTSNSDYTARRKSSVTSMQGVPSKSRDSVSN